MPFKQNNDPIDYQTGEDLTADMIGIGMLFGGDSKREPPIERTLVAASIEGLMNDDGRVMSLLTDWISMHYQRIYVDRLYQLLRALDPARHLPILIYWTANAQRLKKDPRFSKIAKLYQGPRVNYERMGRHQDESFYDGTDFLIQKNGEDERFKGTCIRVPNKTLRHRLTDILPAKELALQHSFFRYRAFFGSNLRADVWATLNNSPGLSAAELARKCHCSYTAAHSIKKDFSFARNLGKPRPI